MGALCRQTRVSKKEIGGAMRAPSQRDVVSTLYACWFCLRWNRQSGKTYIVFFDNAAGRAWLHSDTLTSYPTSSCLSILESSSWHGFAAGLCNATHSSINAIVFATVERKRPFIAFLVIGYEPFGTRLGLPKELELATSTIDVSFSLLYVRNGPAFLYSLAGCVFHLRGGDARHLWISVVAILVIDGSHRLEVEYKSMA